MLRKSFAGNRHGSVRTWPKMELACRCRPSRASRPVCGRYPRRYGGIVEPADLRANLHMNCIPETMLDGEVPDYDDFLEQRRGLMALKIKRWFELL